MSACQVVVCYPDRSRGLGLGPRVVRASHNNTIKESSAKCSVKVSNLLLNVSGPSMFFP